MVIAFNRDFLKRHSNLLNFVKLWSLPRKYQESKTVFFNNEFENRSLVQEPDCQGICAVVILSNDPTSLQAQISRLPLSLPEPVFIIPSPFCLQQRGECAKYSRRTFEREYEERVDLLIDDFSICGFQEKQALYVVEVVL